MILKQNTVELNVAVADDSLPFNSPALISIKLLLHHRQQPAMTSHPHSPPESPRWENKGKTRAHTNRVGTTRRCLPTAVSACAGRHFLHVIQPSDAPL